MSELIKLDEYLRNESTFWFLQSIRIGNVLTNIPTDSDKSIWPLPSSMTLKRTLSEPVNLDKVYAKTLVKNWLYVKE
jgi:hypothetical protein